MRVPIAAAPYFIEMSSTPKTRLSINNNSRHSQVARHKSSPPPQSCDTFAVVGEKRQEVTLFGKNSDRPHTETHEVIRYPRATHPAKATLRCQYITIPQSRRTHAVVLSRPTWLWGAEMGANEHGVCVGNEAVRSRLRHLCDDGRERLLGMDIVRIVLERAATAREGVDVATRLLEEFGQGGSCEDEGGDWCYENGFLICDAREAYVLETAGANFWAVERVGPGGRRNISNGLSIRKPTFVHEGLKEFLIKKKWWREEEDFDWKQIMMGNGNASDNLEPEGREKAGREWIEKMPMNMGFSHMADILRDKESGICMKGYFESTGSQVSVLSDTITNNVHWFTTGSDPSRTCYKPFSFGTNGSVGDENQDSTADLWLSHKQRSSKRDDEILHALMSLESELLAQVEKDNSFSSPETFEQALQQERRILGI